MENHAENGRPRLIAAFLLMLGNKSIAQTLPQDSISKQTFIYAVRDSGELGLDVYSKVAFSGAILSYDGSLKYRLAPAPTLLFHGTADKIVPYNKIRFFNKGFYGSSGIANTFRKNNYPFFMYREKGLGHEVAVLPMYKNIPEILDFLDKFVIRRQQLQIDVLYNDLQAKPMITRTAKELLAAQKKLN